MDYAGNLQTRIEECLRNIEEFTTTDMPCRVAVEFEILRDYIGRLASFAKGE